MKSFLPAAFFPNRQPHPPPVSAIGLREQFGGLQEALRDLARRDLAALLAGLPPVSPEVDLFAQILEGTGEDPLAGYRLADWRQGKLPDAHFVAGLLQDPGRAVAIATLQSRAGKELILPRFLHGTFVDGALRHDLARSCQAFLCERVLFHPGPPPQPLFSSIAIARLCLSQPGYVGAGARTALQDALRWSEVETGPPSPWDQWLYRRMAEAPAWQLEAELAALPWVVWRPGDPLPEATGEPDLPDYWPNLIDLDL